MNELLRIGCNAIKTNITRFNAPTSFPPKIFLPAALCPIAVLRGAAQSHTESPRNLRADGVAEKI